MLKNITADYYGYMDDEDGLLIPSEAKCEAEAIKNKLGQWKNSQTNLHNINKTYISFE
jgi:hypothetical protein